MEINIPMKENLEEKKTFISRPENLLCCKYIYIVKERFVGEQRVINKRLRRLRGLWDHLTSIHGVYMMYVERREEGAVQYTRCMFTRARYTMFIYTNIDIVLECD